VRRSTKLSDSGISMNSEDDTSTDASSEASDGDTPVFATPQVPMTRKVKRNTTKRGALMVNAPIGAKDLWKNVQVVDIQDNVCEEDSMMFNYRIDKVGLALAREHQAWKQNQQREQRLWERNNQF
jgi:hypothetical protein